MRDGIVGVALLLQKDRVVETSVGVVGIGYQGKLIVIQCAICLAGVAVGDREVVVRLGECRVGGDGLGVVGDRVGGFIL